MTIQQDIHALAAGQLVELFEIDSTALGGNVLRVHAGTNGLGGNVVWQGQTYQPFPIEASGFEFSGKGQIPRPVLRIANVTGYMGTLVRSFDDLVGAKVTRRRTMVKYLDAVNFLSARRNLLQRTESFDLSPWSLRTSTVAPDAAMAPNGTTTADTITSLSDIGVFQNVGASIGATYVASIHARAGTAPTLRLRDGANNFSIDYTFSSQAVSVAGLSAGNYGVIDAGNGWFRLWIRYVASVGLNFNPRPTTAGTIVLWGAQLEQDSALTAYQPVLGTTFSQNPTADPTAALPDDIYYIDRKSSENKVLIEFELAANFDLAGVMLPKRTLIQNVCTWKYRGTECGYAGTSYFDANDLSVGTVGADVCGKRLTSCKARFGSAAELPYGGFPAVGLTS